MLNPEPSIRLRLREDRITLSGIHLMPRIGVTPGERRHPQACEADVTIWGDFAAAAISDELGRAIDYSQVLAGILETAHTREYNLLESLAYRLADAVLTRFPAVRVAVRVRKRPASLKGKLNYIEVELENSRHQQSEC